MQDLPKRWLKPMSDRVKLAQQIGSWLAKPTDGHLFAERLKLSLAETFPVQAIDLPALIAGSADALLDTEATDLHLIRDVLGNAVSYARTRNDEAMPLLSVTNTSPLPVLIDQGLDRLSQIAGNGDEVVVILNPSIQLAALRLSRGETDLFCLLRLGGHDVGSPLAVTDREAFLSTVRQAAEKHRLSNHSGEPT